MSCAIKRAPTKGHGISQLWLRDDNETGCFRTTGDLRLCWGSRTKRGGPEPSWLAHAYTEGVSEKSRMHNTAHPRTTSGCTYGKRRSFVLHKLSMPSIDRLISSCRGGEDLSLGTADTRPSQRGKRSTRPTTMLEMQGPPCKLHADPTVNEMRRTEHA